MSTQTPKKLFPDDGKTNDKRESKEMLITNSIGCL